MRVVVATDSWKHCLPATAAAAAMATGILRADSSASVDEIPMADGGQGTVEALVRATGGKFEFAEVIGPTGDPVRARFGILGDGKTAVIEMASAAGLELVPTDKRDPMSTTTYGVGQLLLAAADLGVSRIIVGLGGSATNDGGAGMADALGYKLLDANNMRVIPTGGYLGNLARIDASKRKTNLDGITIDVACDVTNPLTGPKGASTIYGPQKGATPAMVRALDANLANWAFIVERDLGRSVANIPGSGAAGGLGAGLLAVAGARLVRGVELVADAVKLRDRIDNADFCMTGEGSLDRQSSFGKTAVGVARICKAADVPCFALAGSVSDDAHELLAEGITAYRSVIPRPADLETSLKHASDWISAAAEQLMRVFLAGVNGRN